MILPVLNLGQVQWPYPGKVEGGGEEEITR
jgi:hypothetical protein